MHFEPASDEHNSIFSVWRQSGRLEDRTCRPVDNGQRVPPCNDVVTLLFTDDEIEEPVGRFVYFDVNPRNGSAELGYTVNPSYRHQGIGTRMLTTAITYLFLTTNLNKLYCQTAAFNLPSIKLLEKLRFHRDGVLREHHELDGQLWDDYIYSILRREWQG